jgi:hypothetical protein
MSTAVRATLLRGARELAQRFMSGAYTVEAVATTQDAGLRVLNSSSSRTRPGRAWLVQITGNVLSFPSSRASGSLLYVSGPGGLESVEAGVQKGVLDLARLGTVVHLGRGTSSLPSFNRLKTQALKVARRYGDAHASAQAWITDYLSAEAASNSGSTNVPNHPAVLIQLRGHFVCMVCRGPTSITGRYITMILFAAPPYYATDFGISNQRVDLRMLGSVITLLP